jgi:hypothetical protein
MIISHRFSNEKAAGKHFVSAEEQPSSVTLAKCTIHKSKDGTSLFKRRTFLSLEVPKLLKIKLLTFVPHQKEVISPLQKS